MMVVVCSFYGGRRCFMAVDQVEETDVVTPCEKCIVPAMWWKEKRLVNTYNERIMNSAKGKLDGG